MIIEILKSRWFVILAISVLVIAVLMITGRKSVHTEIKILAPKSVVWSVLIDKESYREWNSVLIPIEGQLKVGETVKYEFHQDENTKSEIPSKVKNMVVDSLLNQGGGIPGILTYNHKYILEQNGGNCLLTIHEDYRGLGVHFWNPKPVQKAYEKLALELRNRSEK